MLLRGIELSGVPATPMLLRGIELRGMELNGTGLNWIELRGMELRGIELSGIELRGTPLTSRDRTVVCARSGQGVMPSSARSVHQSRPMELRGMELSGIEPRVREARLMLRSDVAARSVSPRVMSVSPGGGGWSARTSPSVALWRGTPCRSVPTRIASHPPIEDSGMLLRGMELSGVPATSMLLRGIELRGMLLRGEVSMPMLLRGASASAVDRSETLSAGMSAMGTAAAPAPIVGSSTVRVKPLSPMAKVV